MATNANPYVVNLVDLQNIAISITGNSYGPNAILQLQTDVGNLQEMVNYEQKTVFTDTIGEFTSGHGVDIISNLTTTTSGTTTAVPSTSTQQYNVQGSMAFVYASGAFTGMSSGALPTSFASSVLATASGTTITITLNPTYSITYFPNYYGTITWYTGSGYSSFQVPNSNVVFTGSQITISNLTSALLAGITPDTSGYSLWLTMTVFN